MYVGMYVGRYRCKGCSYDGLDVTLCMYVDRYVGKQVCRYIGMYVGRYVKEHGLKIFNLHSRKSYQIGRILLTKNDKCDYCSETFGFD